MALLLGLVQLGSPACAAGISSKRQWDSIFAARYPNGDPGFSVTANDSAKEQYAWHNHYWIRAYLVMANTYGDTSYLNKAVALIDHMRENTDRKRFLRGELGLVDYGSGTIAVMQTVYCRKNPGASVCAGIPTTGPMAMPNSWRRIYNGEWRIETLTDGMILQPISRFIDLVGNDDRFRAYRSKAGSYAQFVDSVVRTHEDLYSWTRDTAVPGSYWYIRPSDPFATGKPSDQRLASDELPFNHSATMAVSLLLLDKNMGGKPEYRRRADSILAYFKKYATESDGAMQWPYQLRRPTDIEDFMHGSVDLGFLVLARQLGRPGLTDEDMRKLARVVTRKVYDGNGGIYGEIDGTGGLSAPYASGTVGLEWIDLAAWDSSLVPIVRAVLEKNVPSPDWSRPFLAWANLLAWERKTTVGSGTRAGKSFALEVRSAAEGWTVRAPGASEMRVDVLDLQGRVIRTAHGYGDKLEIPAAGLPRGIHFLRLRRGPSAADQQVRVVR
jgi:hypothetical protein